MVTAEITPAKAQIPYYVVENFESLERTGGDEEIGEHITE
jgi:hypothetical protein